MAVVVVVKVFYKQMGKLHVHTQANSGTVLG